METIEMRNVCCFKSLTCYTTIKTTAYYLTYKISQHLSLHVFYVQTLNTIPLTSVSLPPAYPLDWHYVSPLRNYCDSLQNKLSFFPASSHGNCICLLTFNFNEFHMRLLNVRIMLHSYLIIFFMFLYCVSITYESGP